MAEGGDQAALVAQHGTDLQPRLNGNNLPRKQEYNGSINTKAFVGYANNINITNRFKFKVLEGTQNHAGENHSDNQRGNEKYSYVYITTCLLLAILASFVHHQADHIKDLWESTTSSNLGLDVAISVGDILNNATLQEASLSWMDGLHTPVTRIDPDTYEVDFFKTPAPEQEYLPVIRFRQQKPMQEGRKIVREDFFKDLGSGVRARTVAAVGGAGYGKSEMLKRFAVDVIQKKIPSLVDIDVVHYLNFRDLAELPQTLTAGKLLFGETIEANFLDSSVEWLKRNQKRFLLVIDGADQYPDEKSKLGKEGSFKLYESDASKSTILNSILSGKLFPDIRVLYSSREHTIRHFEDSVRPDRVVALAGFPEHTIKTLVHELAGEKGPAVWSHLVTKSSTILSASSIPMILVFSVSVTVRHLESPPKTLTEVMMYVFNDLMTSEQIRNQPRAYELIHELKAMCFLGTKAGKVTFTRSDLPEHITEKDYRDLVIPILGFKARNQRLFEGLFRFYMVHQILQETLAAIHVAEMDFEEFEQFVGDHLHTPHWVMVRRLLYGLLINKSALKIAKGVDRSTGFLRSDPDAAKLKCLRTSLEQRIQKQQGDKARGNFFAILKHEDNLAELLHAMHESGDRNFASSVKKIDVHNLLQLTQSDIYVITTIISHRSHLDLLYLPQLRDSAKLHTLAAALKKSKCKIKELKIRVIDLSRNIQITDRVIDDMTTIISRCSVIWVFYLPTLQITHLRKLASAVKESDIKIYDMHVGEIPPEDALAICDVLPHVVDALQVYYKLTDATVKLLQGELNSLGHKGSSLTVYYYDSSGNEVKMRQRT